MSPVVVIIVASIYLLISCVCVWNSCELYFDVSSSIVWRKVSPSFYIRTHVKHVVLHSTDDVSTWTILTSQSRNGNKQCDIQQWTDLLIGGHVKMGINFEIICSAKWWVL